MDIIRSLEPFWQGVLSSIVAALLLALAALVFRVLFSSVRDWITQSRGAKGLLRQQLSSPQAEVRSEATIRIFFGVAQWAIVAGILYLFGVVIGSQWSELAQLAFTITSMFSLVVCFWWLFQYQQPAIPTTNDWVSVLTTRRWMLYFNPPSRSKPITFLADGLIAEGKNKNEHSWRVLDGKLELLQENGQVHSRFEYNARSGSFVHTNDSDTHSIKGQYIIAEGG
jgi:hypothetical protein